MFWIPLNFAYLSVNDLLNDPRAKKITLYENISDVNARLVGTDTQTAKERQKMYNGRILGNGRK